MYIPKRYGMSKTEECPFCGNQAIAKNKQGLNVCMDHRDSVLPDIKCLCGSWLDLKAGKYGPYFVCMNCGNINLKKGLEMLEFQKKKDTSASADKKTPLQQKEKVHSLKGKDEFILDSGKYPGFDYGIR